MTLPEYPGNIPDGTSLQVLGWINNGFSALFSKCLSPVPPDDPIAGQDWINSGTGLWYIRDPQGVSWVPIGKFDGQAWVPFVGTSDGGGGGGGNDDTTQLGPYATLAAGEGFAAGRNGTVSVRRIVADDLPALTSSAAGIPPAPSASNAGHVLRPAGWSRLYQDFGHKTFGGQTSYVWSGFPPVTVLQCVWDIRMAGSRVGMVQIGSGGAPKTAGYDGSLKVVNRDGTPLASEAGFFLWQDVWDTANVTLQGSFEITEIANNKYMFHGITRGHNSSFLHHQLGTVTLTGPMNYLRFTTSGAQPIALNAGYARVLGG